MGRGRKSGGGSGGSAGGQARKRGRSSKQGMSGGGEEGKVGSEVVGEGVQGGVEEVLPRRDDWDGSSGEFGVGSGSRLTPRSGMIDKLESFLDSSVTGEDPVEESMSEDDSPVPEVAALPQPSRQSARIRERGGRQPRKFYSPSPPSSKKRGGGGNSQGRSGRKSTGTNRKNSVSKGSDEQEDSLLRNIKLEIPDDRDSESDDEPLDLSLPKSLSQPKQGGQGSHQKGAVGKNKPTPRGKNKVKASIKTETKNGEEESESEMAQCPPPHPSRRRIRKSERKLSDSEVCDDKVKVEEGCAPSPPKKRGRGRPRKSYTNDKATSTPAPDVTPTPRKRGRSPQQTKSEPNETPDAPEPSSDSREVALVSNVESESSSQSKEASLEPSTSKKKTGTRQPRILLDQPLPPGKVVTIERPSTIMLENGHPVSEIQAKVVNVQDPSETPNPYAASSGAPAGGPVIHEKYYVVDTEKDERVLKNPLGIMVKQCIFANHALRTSVIPQIGRKIETDVQASKVLSKALKSEQEKQSKLINSHGILCKVETAKDKVCVEEKAKAEETWGEIEKTKLYNFTMQEGEVQRYFLKHKFEDAEAEIKEETEKKVNEIQAEICHLSKEHEMLLKKVENAEKKLVAETERTERFKDIAGTLLGFLRNANPQVPLPDVEQNVAEELMVAADKNVALSNDMLQELEEQLLAAMISEEESEEEDDFELVE